jgi:CRISPR-associated protein Csm2
MKDAFEQKGFKHSDSGKNYGGGQGRQRSEADGFEQNLVRAFGSGYVKTILNKGGENYNQFIDNLRNYVERNKTKITTSQLRNIFTRVKQLKNPEEAWHLRPQLAYTAGRNDQPAMKELVFLLDQLLCAIGPNDTTHLKNFQDFFEAVIAYHKYFGSK